jgi:hypothetical protein
VRDLALTLGHPAVDTVLPLQEIALFRFQQLSGAKQAKVLS